MTDKIEKLLDGYLADGAIDNAGVYNSLKAKLKQKNLNSFINEIKVQGSKHICSEAASKLLEYAERTSSNK